MNVETWVERQFPEAFKDVTSKAHKIDQSRFQPAGAYPIIDQGKEFIAGYVDDSSLVWKHELPVIIFGDHTREIKYINFPFVLGADGTKVLKPDDTIDPKFAYYTLLSINISSAGYSRHFKFLKESSICLPRVPEEQKRIAAILGKADRLRRLRRYALELSDTYLQSVFLEMFGDPVTNPMGWAKSKIGAQISNIRYGTGSPPQYVEKGHPFIRATNVKNGRIEKNGLVYISETDAKKIPKCQVNSGDIILVRSGVNTGDCAIIPDIYHGSYAAYDLIIEAPFPLNYYYALLINSNYGKSVIEPLSRRAGQPHINAEQVKSLSFPIPDRPLIEKLAQIVQKFEHLQSQQREAERQAEHLFQTLLHRAFRGELS